MDEAVSNSVKITVSRIFVKLNMILLLFIGLGIKINDYFYFAENYIAG